MKPLFLASVTLVTVQIAGCNRPQADDLPPPNILWLTSEDNSAFLGCYGDKFATTPILDNLAEEGFLYTRAYANCPVCSPARTTIITGLYANSGGGQNHRSSYSKPDAVNFYTHYLREKGYYTTNNSKEDYNIDPRQTADIWDESSTNAHYKNRKQGQPFFAVFNTTISHESSLHQPKPADQLRHDASKVPLPPYHPDTPEIRHDWAYYYDKIEEMDAWVGKMLKELEDSGEAENTIIFYYSDHGGVLARSKRYVYETGTHVPFIVRIPEKYKHLWPADEPGNRIDRLISFVDLAPTLLSIIDTPVPDYMQGDAFLGSQKTPDPGYVYMFRDRTDEVFDMSRSVRDNKYRYIRNYMPHLVYGQKLEYMWRAPSTGSWEEACKAGNCNEIQQAFWNTKPAEELYDTENDPWEVNNLASDPAYRHILEKMRKVNREWMLDIKDTGLIPEADLSERAGNISAYDFLRDENIDLEGIITAAETATAAGPDDLDELESFLSSDENAIRYWGATGLLLLEEHSRDAVPLLIEASEDPSPNVSIIASEILYRFDEADAGRRGLVSSLDSPNSIARTQALNAIDRVDDTSEEVKNAVIQMISRADEINRRYFDHRAARVLLLKWGIDPADFRFEW